jgi:polyhydroxyalkanoate synthesis regulator phasin
MSTATNTDTTKTLNERIDAARAELKEAVEKAQAQAKELAEKLEARAKSLREELEKAREKGLAESAKAAAGSTTNTLKSLPHRAISALGLASNDEVAALNKKLDSLTRKIRKLEKGAA